MAVLETPLIFCKEKEEPKNSICHKKLEKKHKHETKKSEVWMDVGPWSLHAPPKGSKQGKDKSKKVFSWK